MSDCIIDLSVGHLDRLLCALIGLMQVHKSHYLSMLATLKAAKVKNAPNALSISTDETYDRQVLLVLLSESTAVPASIHDRLIPASQLSLWQRGTVAA